MLRVRGQSQRASWTYLLGRSPLEDQDGEKPKVTIMQKTNVTCPQSFDCVFVIPLGSHETSSCHHGSGISNRGRQPSREIYDLLGEGVQGEIKCLPETAESCCLWLQAQVSGGFHEHAVGREATRPWGHSPLSGLHKHIGQQILQIPRGEGEFSWGGLNKQSSGHRE